MKPIKKKSEQPSVVEKKLKIEKREPCVDEENEGDIIISHKSKLYLNYWQIFKEDWEDFSVEESDSLEKAFIDNSSTGENTKIFFYKNESKEYMIDFEKLLITCISEEKHLTNKIRRVCDKLDTEKMRDQKVNSLTILNSDLQRKIFGKVLEKNLPPPNVFSLTYMSLFPEKAPTSINVAFSSQELAEEVLEKYGMNYYNGWLFVNFIQKNRIITSLKEFEELISKEDSNYNALCQKSMKEMWKNPKGDTKDKDLTLYEL